MTFLKVYDTLYERVMSKVVLLDWQNENGCWIFTGRLDQDGYGRVNVRIDGRHVTLRAHKVVWEAVNGPLVLLGDDMTLDHDHDCVGKACCNFDHLEPVTRAENTRRARANRSRRALQA